MARTRWQKAWLLLVVCWLGSVSAPAWAVEVPNPLITKDLLDSAGLTLVWQTKLPLRENEGERFEAVTLLEDRLYVRSTENYMWSLDRKSGSVAFNRSIAPKGFALLGWNAYEDCLITVIDNQLVELDKASGKQVRVGDLGISIIAPPVRNGSCYFAGASDHRVHAYHADNLVPNYEMMAENESQVTTVLVFEDMVLFGTDAGNVIAAAPDAPRKLWQFDAPEAIAGDVVRDGQSFYFANKDTQVYRVDVKGAGQPALGWKYQTEAVLDRSPRVTSTTVYQYARGRGVTAIDKQSGQALWTLPEGVELLAEAANRAYVMTKFNTLAVMHNGVGKQLHWVNFRLVTGYASNTVDGRIYVADNQGRVACLEPAL